jgi:hypothetical protein
VSCPIGFYRETPRLRVRPVPEMRTCLVYVPDRAQLYTLNVDAWLIFELARAHGGKALLERYREAIGGAAEAAATRLRAGLDRLVANGIIETAQH